MYTPINIIKVFKQIIKLPYYKNYSAESGAFHNIAKHEDAISNVLIENNFTLIPTPKKLNRKETLKWINQPELSTSMPVGTFYSQPFNKNASPDFIIKVCEKLVLFLEAKSSSRQTYPMYNSGGINPDFIYVFCSNIPNENQTTIYKGDSIINMEQLRLIQEHIEKQREFDKEVNRKLNELDPNNRGITYYTRPMIIQSGGKRKTNYFTHEHRIKCEKKVFEWLEDKLLINN